MSFGPGSQPPEVTPQGANCRSKYPDVNLFPSSDLLTSSPSPKPEDKDPVGHIKVSFL